MTSGINSDIGQQQKWCGTLLRICRAACAACARLLQVGGQHNASISARAYQRIASPRYRGAGAFLLRCAGKLRAPPLTARAARLRAARHGYQKLGKTGCGCCGVARAARGAPLPYAGGATRRSRCAAALIKWRAGEGMAGSRNGAHDDCSCRPLDVQYRAGSAARTWAAKHTNATC